MAAQGDHGCLWPDTLPSTGSGKASLRGNPRITTRYVRDLRPFSQDPWGLHNPSCPWRRINSIHVTGGRGEGLARRKCLIHVSCQDHGPGLVHGAPRLMPAIRIFSLRWEADSVRARNFIFKQDKGRRLFM